MVVDDEGRVAGGIAAPTEISEGKSLGICYQPINAQQLSGTSSPLQEQRIAFHFVFVVKNKTFIDRYDDSNFWYVLFAKKNLQLCTDGTTTQARVFWLPYIMFIDASYYRLGQTLLRKRNGRTPSLASYQWG